MFDHAAEGEGRVADIGPIDVGDLASKLQDNTQDAQAPDLAPAGIAHSIREQLRQSAVRTGVYDRISLDDPLGRLQASYFAVLDDYPIDAGARLHREPGSEPRKRGAGDRAAG